MTTGLVAKNYGCLKVVVESRAADLRPHVSLEHPGDG